MKRSRFSEEQIIAILREQEAGSTTADVCRKWAVWHDLLASLKPLLTQKNPASVHESTGQGKYSSLSKVRPNARNTVVNRIRHAICVDASFPSKGSDISRSNLGARPTTRVGRAFSCATVVRTSSTFSLTTPFLPFSFRAADSVAFKRPCLFV